MSTPQKILTYLYWLFLGAMALGGVVGVLNDTYDFITLPVSVVGTVFIALFWILAPHYLSNYPWKTKSGYITRLNSGLKVSLLGMIALLWLPQITQMVPARLDFPAETEEESLIVIATFDRTEGVTDTNIHGEIARKISEVVADSQIKGIRVQIAPNTIAADNKEAAQDLGQQYDASFIIWGADTGVRLEVNFLNLKQPDFSAAAVTLNETERTQIAQPEAYSRFVVDDLPSQISFLALFALGQASYNDENFDAALEQLKTAVNLIPDIDNVSEDFELEIAYFRLGWLNGQLNPPNHIQALSDYNKAIQLDDSFTTAYLNRCWTYEKLGELTQALEDCNKAIQLEPNFALAYNNRAFLSGKLGNSAQELADYEKAIQLDPNYALAHNNLGAVYLLEGNQRLSNSQGQSSESISKAIDEFEIAIELEPGYADAYVNRGSAFTLQGELSLALQDYNNAIELNPNLSHAYYGRGAVYFTQKNYSLAIEDFTQALELNPGIVELYYNRGKAYAENGNTALALDDFQKFLELMPNSPEQSEVESYIRANSP